MTTHFHATSQIEAIQDWIAEQSFPCEATLHAFGTTPTPTAITFNASSITVTNQPPVLVVSIPDKDKAAIFKMFWSDHIEEGPATPPPPRAVCRIGLW